MTIHPITPTDSPWVSQALTNLWGSLQMVSRGKLVSFVGLPGFIAQENGRKIGLITYKIESLECEIVTINALIPRKGIGSMLLSKVEEIAKEKGCTHLLVITTNDNPQAVKFYEKSGFTVVAVRKNIMDEYRKLKPEIPLIGNNGVPLTDEIELQKAI